MSSEFNQMFARHWEAGTCSALYQRFKRRAGTWRSVDFIAALAADPVELPKGRLNTGKTRVSATETTFPEIWLAIDESDRPIRIKLATSDLETCIWEKR